MLACERHGSGEPLVLVHGLTHRRQAWYPVLDHLVDHREVVLVDLPGHGASPDLVTGGRPVADVLRDLFKDFLDHEGLVGARLPHIAGNSLGGRIALEAAVNGHARSVTGLSPAGFWRTEASFAYTRRIFTSAATVVQHFGAQADRLARTRAGRRAVYSALMSHPTRVPVDHALGDIRSFRRSLPALRILLDEATPFHGEIDPQVPVTIAWAARDLVLPPWQAEVARAVLPHAEHLTMRGAGHVPMFDDPKRVARILLRGSAPVTRLAPLRAVADAPPGHRVATA